VLLCLLKCFARGLHKSFDDNFVLNLLILQLSENVVWFCRQIDGETRIGIFTKQDVKEGTPLVYDYQ
jgi:hypothetical protein